MSFTRCGVSTTVKVWTAGVAEFAMFDVFEELPLLAGGAPQADIKKAMKVSAISLIKTPKEFGGR
jgi:hypothetical protein